ncbi:Transcription factor tau 131 kDa subunit [Ceratocystis lukuohia]|uniref:Transcription factor tau 131 kDa subunit n=1 Tax=Ceratocystis lukuohia TaxID=2019550 RepID=A0ABR4M8C4_9PEZI
MMELENDIEKYNKSVHDFLAAHRGESNTNVTKPQKPKGALRGPRKAAEPRGDIKARLSKANQAFLSGDYLQARNFIFEVIRINAETHQAWITLASIFREEGLPDKALMSMVYGAHLRPKDVAGWMKVAQFALGMTTDVENALTTARLCYSAALRADSKNIAARVGRAAVCLEQNQVSLAIADYRMVLNQTPLDIDVIRKLADACLDSPNIQTAAPVAIKAYQEFIEFEMSQIDEKHRKFSWNDVIFYTELLSASNQFYEAIGEVKRLSRWLLSMPEDPFWRTWTLDDREFDVQNTRRAEVYEGTLALVSYDEDQLPIQLRVRLGTNRLKLGDAEEGLRHLECLHPTTLGADARAHESPYLIQVAAEQIFDAGMMDRAIPYFELLRQIIGSEDAGVLFHLGQCHVSTGDMEAAEECFLATIEIDESNIEARVELAKMYENAKEGEEALILVTEAIALQNAQMGEEDRNAIAGEGADIGDGPQPKPRSKNTRTPKRRKKASGMIPTRFRPRRLGDPSQRRKAEQERMKGLLEKYGEAQTLRSQIYEGDDSIVYAWAAVAKELIDDFRSSKKFYTWDKYLKLLGRTAEGDEAQKEGAKSALDEMAERLTKVCDAARDSTVFRTSSDFTTRIYLTWGACAAFAGDEEACVSISRNLIRDNPTSADAYRMFAIMSRICQSSASWYNSGPAQKFLLRQIKAMDGPLLASSSENNQGSLESPDVNVLMLYGHILFMSTSYTYALHYFMRARSLDPTNPAINLSIGLAYIHYALKRQSVNRQYLILQGVGFVIQYAQEVEQSDPTHLSEAKYNVARILHLVGLPHLSQVYMPVGLTPMISLDLSDLEVQARYNLHIMHLLSNTKGQRHKQAEANLIL